MAMSEAKIPVVRLPTLASSHTTDEQGTNPDTVVVELPVSNKFGFAWPVESAPSAATPSLMERPSAAAFSSSDGETDGSEDEMKETMQKPSRSSDTDDFDFVAVTNRVNTDRNPPEQGLSTSGLPRLTRALTMPLPSQLESLQNPRRTSSPGSSEQSSILEVSESGHFHEISLELADSVQTVIQILLQLSPPQVLDPAKEQFSSCSLSFPTPSVSAIFTSMKHLNYMSANMSTLGLDPSVPQSALGEEASPSYQMRMQSDFDVGEMLQSVGDALSGVAAQAGVDLVLFHGDVGMKHVAVRGDESGISYTLSHVSECCFL